MLACPAVAFWAWNVEMMVVVVLVVLAPQRLSWVGGIMWLLLRFVGLRPRTGFVVFNKNYHKQVRWQDVASAAMELTKILTAARL